LSDETQPVDAAPVADAAQPKNPRDAAERPTISYAKAIKAVRKLFGPTGRIWRTDDGGYALGIDKRPGRQVLVTGPDLWLLLFGRYAPPPPPKVDTQPVEAPVSATAANVAEPISEPSAELEPK
jgi:hypothetical protein